MKVELKKLDASRIELIIEADSEVVAKKFEEVFKKIAQEAKVPGFRPGNAPRDMIEKQYSSQAHDQALKELIPDVYNEAINKENIDVIELPEISDVKLERNSLTFKATVEVSPEIALKDYKGIKVNYKAVDVSPDEIKRNMDSIKESRKADVMDDKFAQGLCYPTVQALEKAVQTQIFIHKDNHERQRIENQVIEELEKGLDFKLPQSMVDRQLQDMVRQAKVDLALKGVPKETIDEDTTKITTELEPEAKKQVKIYLILAQIAKKENIPVDNQMPRKVLELLLKEADWKEVA